MKIEISEEELKRNPQIRKKVEELIQLKFEAQKGKEYFEVNEPESEIIKTMDFVSKEKYGETKYSGEIGKWRGKRVILKQIIKQIKEEK